MNILYSILLGILISSNLLLAQSESKQVIGYRVNGTEGREQPTGNREQDKNRLKAEETKQVTGCRLQETGKRKKELLSGNKIAYRVEPTTNCNTNQVTGCRLQGTGSEIRELPSGDKIDDNLDCYLMMNPEVTKGLEDILKVSRNLLLSSEASSEREMLNAASVSSIEGECSISATIPSQSDVIENNFTNLEEKIAKITTQIEQAKQASKEKQGGENSYLWDRIATKLEQARDSWNKVHELVEQGNQERISLWRKAAEESEASGEKMKEAIISYISGDESTAKQIEKASWSAYHLSSAFIR